MVFTVAKSMAIVLCDIVMGQPRGTTKALNDLEQSAMKEVGSIISASYLNAVSRMTGLGLVISVPTCSIGEVKLLNRMLIEKNGQAQDSRQIICIETEFMENTIKIKGYLIFIPDGDAAGKIIKSLGV